MITKTSQRSPISGFTIVEVLIVVVVIAILAGISVVAYSGIRVAALRTAAQHDLKTISTAMQIERIEKGSYPADIPETVRQSGGNVTSTIKWSGKITRYTSLTAVQNGVLLADICQKLIDEGVGRAANQGGAIQNYVTGCGNWNRSSMQVTAWNTRVWNTPVSSQQLLQYAQNFTSSDTWNASQVTVVKNFYNQLVERHLAMGGTFPVTSFWDSWATSGNGGVMYQNLPEDVETKESFCVEATIEGRPDLIWHIDEDDVMREGACE